jgi:hypothetical protein
MGDAFEMDKISHSPKSISLLKEMAEKQIEDIRDMDVWEMIQCDESRYSHIRKVYERAGIYLYPSDLKKDDKNYKKRMDLYREYSNRADEIFREKLEDYYHTDKLPQKTKDKLWGKAWEQGHSAGYNDVACAYEDISDVVMSMVE